MMNAGGSQAVVGTYIIMCWVLSAAELFPTFFLGRIGLFRSRDTRSEGISMPSWKTIFRGIGHVTVLGLSGSIERTSRQDHAGVD